MIAIVDSGSTKSDWLIVDSEGMEQFRTKTIGMNPYFISSEDIANEIRKNQHLMKEALRISHVFFYGAGCSTSEYNQVVEKGLAQVFKKSKIRVEHDLLAAAYSAYRNRPAIVCILGTGSNSCYFDGQKLHEETPSLAFILGDEGSGSNLGKRIIRAYFLKKMPKRLSRAFQERFNLTLKELNQNVYNNKFANVYLASFSRFVIDHKHEPFIQKIIYDSLNEFMINQVLVYPQAKSVELNFIGSVAHFYEDTLAAVASEYHLKIGEIIKNPIDNLVRYHATHIIPKLEPSEKLILEHST